MLLALLFAGAMVAGFTVIAIYRAVAGGDLSAGTAAVVVFLGVAVLLAAREAVKRF